jgi:hypothetical protein
VLISDEMIDRAMAVLFSAPGLDYEYSAGAEAHNRTVIARALAAALEVT